MGKRKYPIPTIGQTFGDWTVTDNTLQYDYHTTQKAKGVTVQCKCGYTRIMTPSVLFRNISRQCTSCKGKQISNIKFTGAGQLSGTYFGQIKNSATQRNFKFDVTKEYIWALFLQQKGQCALTGLDLILTKSYSGKSKKKVNDETASLDRIDSKLGYIEGNVQWVHKTINMMKNNLKQDEFIDFCRAVVLRNTKPRTQVITRLKVEGIHRWKKCPIKEVNFLQNYHRHIFFIEAYSYVSHSDRDVEFIQLSHKIKSYLTKKYFNEHYQCLFFDDKSCEMIAHELVTFFDLAACEVNEDGEGGALVRNK